MATLYFAWVKTLAGAIKTAVSATVAALATLVSFEIEPVLGLFLLIAFEASTDYAIRERLGKSRWERLKDVIKVRAWLMFAVLAGIVFANSVQPPMEMAVKAGLVLVVGGICLIVGWYRIGTRAPILGIMADLAVQRLRGKGVDLSLADEEGNNLSVSARIKDIDAGPQAGPRPTFEAE